MPSLLSDSIEESNIPPILGFPWSNENLQASVTIKEHLSSRGWLIWNWNPNQYSKVRHPLFLPLAVSAREPIYEAHRLLLSKYAAFRRAVNAPMDWHPTQLHAVNAPMDWHPPSAAFRRAVNAPVDWHPTQVHAVNAPMNWHPPSAAFRHAVNAPMNWHPA